MSYKITEECINCGACEPECPNSAIYEGGTSWELGGAAHGEGDASPAGASGFFSSEYFYIVPDKCTECVGFFDEPQCVEACPVDCCIPDPNHVEEKDALMAKKESLGA